MDRMETIGVGVFVLRKAGDDTRVLLMRRAAGSFQGEWCPVAGSLDADETEVEAALRELAEETGLRAERLYALPGLVENADPAVGAVGRIGVFVAFVAEGARVELGPEHSEHRWLGFDAAAGLLPLAAQRATLADVRARFARRAPDEALRVR